VDSRTTGSRGWSSQGIPDQSTISGAAMTMGRSNAIRVPRGHRAQAGILLIEAVVYLSLFFLISGLAGAGFYRALEHVRRLDRTANEIGTVVSVGELWRADIRSATAPIRLEGQGANPRLVIPHGSSNTIWTSDKDVVSRQPPGQRAGANVLHGLAASVFLRDHRENATSWRWEIELTPARTDPAIHPMFTFQAIAPPDQLP